MWLQQHFTFPFFAYKKNPNKNHFAILQHWCLNVFRHAAPLFENGQEKDTTCSCEKRATIMPSSHFPVDASLGLSPDPQGR